MKHEVDGLADLHPHQHGSIGGIKDRHHGRHFEVDEVLVNDGDLPCLHIDYPHHTLGEFGGKFAVLLQRHSIDKHNAFQHFIRLNTVFKAPILTRCKRSSRRKVNSS
ncbi:hypothetical protein [Hoeflea sp.]|uniref:hypothetical protein n=1 Tax=Hoeflea sp. TaxID=1940281 RepID=UPI0025C69D7A|nr:hypothetical protein [Hoeflea sp.]